MLKPVELEDYSFKLLGVFSIWEATWSALKIRKVFYKWAEISGSIKPKIAVFMFPPKAWLKSFVTLESLNGTRANYSP